MRLELFKYTFYFVVTAIFFGQLGAYAEETMGLEDNDVVEVNLFTGEGVSLGGVLFPHIHASGVTGVSTAGEISRLANGHHDPQTDVTLQTLEVGASLRLGDYVEGFGVYSAYTDADGDMDGELEEAFLKLVKLPGGFELRGGRILNRFGFQAGTHNHSWDFVNQTLMNGRLLHEGELATDGGEVTWHVPTPFRSALSFSVGEVRSHDHDHEHTHTQDAEFDAEGAWFSDTFFTLNYLAQWDYNDFHQNRLTLSAAWGDNVFDRSTQVYGVGYEYQWRENGYEAGGTYFRLRNELVYRRFGAVSDEHTHDAHHAHEHHEQDEHDEHHEHHEHDIVRKSLDDLGFYSSAHYGFNEHVEAGVRVGYVSSVAEAGLDERWRVSPNMTYSLNAQRTLYARIQYDFDYSSEFGDDHSVWFQIGFNWGTSEVR